MQKQSKQDQKIFAHDFGHIETNFHLEKLKIFENHKEFVINFCNKFWNEICTLSKRIDYLHSYVHSEWAGVPTTSFGKDISYIFSYRMETFFRNLLDPVISSSVNTDALDKGKPFDVNFIKQKFRENIEGVIKDVYKLFYKSNSGPYDGEFCDLGSKIIKIHIFLETLCDSTILTKLVVNTAHFMRYLIDKDKHSDSFSQIIQLFMIQNLLETTATQRTAEKILLVKEDIIDKLNTILQGKSHKDSIAHINHDSLFKMKILKSEREIYHDVQSAIDQGIHESLQLPFFTNELAKIEKEIKEIVSELNSIKTTLNKIENLATKNNFFKLVLDKFYETDTDISNKLIELIHSGKSEIHKIDEKNVIEDGHISEVWINIAEGALTIDNLNLIEPNYAGMQIFVRVEKLIYLVGEMYIRMNHLCKQLQVLEENKKVFHKKLTNQVIYGALNILDGNYKKKGSPIIFIIDSLFISVQQILQNQEQIQVELKAKHKERILSEVSQIKSRKERVNFVNINLSDLSKLIKISINELKLQKGSTDFVYYNVQENILTHLHNIKSRHYHNTEKHLLFYYIFKDIDRFQFEGVKIYLAKLQESEIILQEYILVLYSEHGKQHVISEAKRYEINSSENGKFIVLKPEVDPVIIDLEEGLMSYDYESLLSLSFYQIFYKSLIVESLKNQSEPEMDNLVSPIMLSIEHMQEFASFLNGQKFRPRNSSSIISSASHLFSSSMHQEKFKQIVEGQKRKHEMTHFSSAQYMNEVYDLTRTARPQPKTSALATTSKPNLGAKVFMECINEVRIKLDEEFKKKSKPGVEAFMNEIKQISIKLEKQKSSVQIFLNEINSVQKKLNHKLGETSQYSVGIFMDEIYKIQKMLEGKREEDKKKQKVEDEMKQKAIKAVAEKGSAAANTFYAKFQNIKDIIQNKNKNIKIAATVLCDEFFAVQKMLENQKENQGKKSKLGASAFEREFTQIKKKIEDKNKNIKIAATVLCDEFFAVQKMLENQKENQGKKSKLGANTFEREFIQLKKIIEEKNKKAVKCGKNATDAFYNEFNKLKKTISDSKAQAESDIMNMLKSKSKNGVEAFYTEVLQIQTQLQAKEANIKNKAVNGAECFGEELVKLKKRIQMSKKFGQNGAEGFFVEINQLKKKIELMRKKALQATNIFFSELSNVKIKIVEKEAKMVDSFTKALSPRGNSKESKHETPKISFNQPKQESPGNEDLYDQDFDEEIVEDIEDEDFKGYISQPPAGKKSDPPPKVTTQSEILPAKGRNNLRSLVSESRKDNDENDENKDNNLKKIEESIILESWGKDPYESTEGHQDKGIQAIELINESTLDVINKFLEMSDLLSIEIIEEYCAYGPVMNLFLEYVKGKQLFLWDLSESELINSEFKSFLHNSERNKTNDMVQSCKEVAKILSDKCIEVLDVPAIDADTMSTYNLVIPFDPSQNKFKISGIHINLKKKFVYFYSNDSYSTNLKGKDLADLNALVNFCWNIGRFCSNIKQNHFQDTKTMGSEFTFKFITLSEHIRQTVNQFHPLFSIFIYLSVLFYDNSMLPSEDPVKYADRINKLNIEEVDIRRYNATLTCHIEFSQILDNEQALMMYQNQCQMVLQSLKAEGDFIDLFQIDVSKTLMVVKKSLEEAINKIDEIIVKAQLGIIAIEFVISEEDPPVVYYLGLNADEKDKQSFLLVFENYPVKWEAEILKYMQEKFKSKNYDFHLFKCFARHNMIQESSDVFLARLGLLFRNISENEGLNMADLFSITCYNLAPFTDSGNQDEEEDQMEGNYEIEGLAKNIQHKNQGPIKGEFQTNLHENKGKLQNVFDDDDDDEYNNVEFDNEDLEPLEDEILPVTKTNKNQIANPAIQGNFQGDIDEEIEQIVDNPEDDDEFNF